MVFTSCGGTTRSGPTPPPSSDAAHGAAGNALVSSNRTDLLWVGFNTKQQWDQLVEKNKRFGPAGRLQVGGKVVPDSSRPLGFYFDPSTTFAVGPDEAVVAIYGFTTLDRIKADPVRFAESGLAGHIVPVVVEQMSGP